MTSTFKVEVMSTDKGAPYMKWCAGVGQRREKDRPFKGRRSETSDIRKEGMSEIFSITSPHRNSEENETKFLRI